MNRRTLFILGVTMFLALAAATPAAAQEEDEEDEGPVIDLSALTDAIEDLVDEVEQLGDDLGDIIVEAGLTLLVEPFHALVQTISETLSYVMVSYPDVKHQDVLDVHHTVFQLTLLLAVPVLIWIGFQHITGRADGIRPTVELLAVVAAGGVSPWLLYYPVELSRLAAAALRPGPVSTMSGLSVTLTTAVVIWIQAAVLLALVILFIVQSFYLLFYVAASPLIFLLTYFQPTRKFASPLTGLFIGFLLIGPMDLIAYQLVLALLDMQGQNALPQYIWGLGGYFVMLALPFQILSSSSSLVLPALLFSRNAAGKAGDRVKPKVREQYQNFREKGTQRINQARNRFAEKKPDQVRLQHRSNNEVEMHQTGGRLHRAKRKVKDRIRQDETKVDVEENWHQDQNGDWTKETELRGRGDK
ncbi:hypothetical protein [Haloplanus aerogenes]|uniref:Uncharacterized protein n=1 Tax=Haloplanus aerogenes TaxID=660522 RepID=A0A3M0CU28_9EURY|nr:hypothetical protein [Haloplanus aerogenes]AZH26686.1 hypothetical protein DU502_15455 [Haloplanus aerogenes]RMB12924.1 hypothetical protein ATH50_3080 [Haloplanus aerogenes]